MNLSELFRSLTATDIQAFIEEGQEENLYLEFKTVKSASLKSDDDKRNLARALSGFANSSGGVIVWGIDARKGVNGIDCAQSIVAVKPVRELLARLNELAGLAISPAIDGVQHRAIEISENSGVVVTLVPESDRGPHMAKFSDDRYYKRSGDSFYRLEHFDIADMFGRRAHPVLGLSTRWDVRFASSGGGGATARLTIRIIIENHGRGLARYPAVTLGKPSWTASHWLGQLGGQLNLPLVRAPQGWWLRYAGGADVVIYPADEFEVTSVSFDIAHTQTDVRHLVIPVWVVAADAQALRSDLQIDAGQICEATARALAERGWDFHGKPTSEP